MPKINPTEAPQRGFKTGTGRIKDANPLKPHFDKKELQEETTPKRRRAYFLSDEAAIRKCCLNCKVTTEEMNDGERKRECKHTPGMRY